MKTSTGIAVALAVIVALVFLFLGSSAFSLFGSESTPQEQAQGTNTMDATATELQITDTVVGTGATAENGKTVTVEYVGRFQDGTVFDASANHSPDGFSFPLGQGRVIAGWEQGLLGMKEGGTRTLVIPPALGYGPNDYGPIPGNSTLIFEVKLLKVQ